MSKEDKFTLTAFTHIDETLAKLGGKSAEDLINVAEELRKVMEQQSLHLRDLILEQPPLHLLGYLWSQLYISALAELREQDKDYRPNKELLEKYQFALEYIHAVWCCHREIVDNESELDVASVDALFDALIALKDTAFVYSLASTAPRDESREAHDLARLEFQAKSAWILIRGNRYQVLEEEFFRFVLEPHADVLQSAYNMGPASIAAGIQTIANVIRTGYSDAIEKIDAGMERTFAAMDRDETDLPTAIKKMKESDGDFTADISGAIMDIFYGGICNLSRHTNFTPQLLEDLSYLPGENTEFFSSGPFQGTPMRTLPARIKPGIKIDEDYYFTDGQFVRDTAYRAIQRGLLNRLPEYREDWNRRQKTLIEGSFHRIFDQQLADSTRFSEVYYRDPHTGHWAETDLLITIGDVLIIVEAKAGVLAMDSPATNFDRHERKIRNLIVKAYEQCRRFTSYLSSAPEVALYKRTSGKYVETGRLRQRDFRVILPIGLTVEAFTPFSAMSKELAEIEPLLDKHPFISMSVDDLFVLNRFLPTTGELLHYLEVRQQVAGIPNATLFDEIEHLGAYITDNRFDMRISDQLSEADRITWDSFGDPVDKYFEGENWDGKPVPRQEYPEELFSVLQALDNNRPSGWLEIDAHIRNLGTSGRNNLAKILADLRGTLSDYPNRRVLFGDEHPLQIWLCRNRGEPSVQKMQYQGEVGCLVANVSRLPVLRLSFDDSGEIVEVFCASYQRPPMVRSDYVELDLEAERQRARFNFLGNEK